MSLDVQYAYHINLSPPRPLKQYSMQSYDLP